MPRKGFGELTATLAVCVLALPSAALAQKRQLPPVETVTYTKNPCPQGYSPMGNTPNLPELTFTANSDLAFWGKLAFQGHYDGFRIVNIASPTNPRDAVRGQPGGHRRHEDILVRAWNSPAPAGSTCDGQPVPTGFEGVHSFDISDLDDPVLVGSVEISTRAGADALGCGSHTITGVPDLDSNTLVIYNQSACTCPAEAFHVFEGTT